uniref:Cysteine protease n=1 Tax=Macrostomum lignano TaxID=282301 RepID=A0A1I8IVU1_9PLAT
MVEATGNSYESGPGVEYDDLPLRAVVLASVTAYSTKHDREDIRLRPSVPPVGDLSARLLAQSAAAKAPKTDKSWGCMLRCGQMMLAEAITLLRLFEDNKAAPFSIHQIASMGVSDGKPVGQWFGPNTVAQAIRKLSAFDQFANLLVHVALDNTLSGLQSSAAICAPPPGPVRPQQQYVPALKPCLEMPQSLGIIGGKPNHAHYFIGYQGNELYYLDPHTTQDCAAIGPAVSGVAAAATASGTAAPDASYHCPSLRRMPFARLDPSLAVGFVCANEAQLDDLCASLVRRMVQQFDLPLFEVHQTRPSHWPAFEPYTLASQIKFDQQEDEEDDNYVLL